MVLTVEIKFIHCLAGLTRQWIAQSDGIVHRHFNVVALAGGNLLNRHRLEHSFNQSASKIRTTHYIKTDKSAIAFPSPNVDCDCSHVCPCR